MSILWDFAKVQNRIAHVIVACLVQAPGVMPLTAASATMYHAVNQKGAGRLAQLLVKTYGTYEHCKYHGRFLRTCVCSSNQCNDVDEPCREAQS